MSPLGGLAAQARWLLIGSRGQSLPLNLNFNKRQQLLNSIRWISRNCTVSISSARRSSGAFNRKFTETDSQQLESPDRINSAHNICTSGKSSDERHINQLLGCFSSQKNCKSRCCSSGKNPSIGRTMSAGISKDRRENPFPPAQTCGRMEARKIIRFAPSDQRPVTSSE